MTTFQMDLADRWLVVPLGDADAVAHWPADLGREPRYEDPDDVERLLDAARRVAGIPADDTLAVRLLYLPDPPFHPVFTDLHELVAEGEADERLPALITVEPARRGPHVSDTVEFADGATAHRSVAAFPGERSESGESGESGADAIFTAFHALRRGGRDLVARTAVGPDALNLVEAVPAVEALLSTLLVSD